MPTTHLTRILIIACVFSLSLAFIDIALSISEKPQDLSLLLFILPSPATAVAFFFLAYLTLWFVIVFCLGRLLKLECGPLTFSLSLFLAASLLLFVIIILPDAYNLEHSFRQLEPILRFVFPSLFISILLYFLVKAFPRSHCYLEKASFVGLALPFLVAITTFFLWLAAYEYKQPLLSTYSSNLTLGYFSSLLLALCVFYFVGKKARIGLVAALMVVVLSSPFLLIIGNKISHSLSSKRADHQIKHVILLTVDTLRSDVLSCYNPLGVPTPHIDQLSSDGILFTKAISAGPWTLPSLSSMMTGLSPLVHRTTKSSSKLPDSFKTLAEYMTDSGYHTSGIGFNYYLHPRFNLSQGFVEYNFFPRSLGKALGTQMFQLLSEKYFRSYMSDASTSDLTQLAIDWLESNRNEDFFLWLHYYDPHVPYSPPRQFLPEGEPPPRIGRTFARHNEVRDKKFIPSPTEKEWIKKLYEGEVRYVDENVGQFLDALKKLNIYDESLIVFGSDHGEEFWEHNGYEHGHALYNEVLQVPLIIKFPRSASKGRIDTWVSTERITPTILDILGIEYDRNYLSDGSLAPLWKANQADLNSQPIISKGTLYFQEQESVIFGDMKYIRFLGTGREELYDLASDPQEKISLFGSSPQIIQQGRNLLRNHKKIAALLVQLYKLGEVEKADIDKETTEKLKSLGYIQ